MASRAMQIRHAINWEMVCVWGLMFLFGAAELAFAVYAFFHLLAGVWRVLTGGQW